jgi:hypothetical protein
LPLGLLHVSFALSRFCRLLRFRRSRCTERLAFAFSLLELLPGARKRELPLLDVESGQELMVDASSSARCTS